MSAPSSTHRSRLRTPRRAAAERGFTLLELMVALVAGLIAISAAYFVGASSSRHFAEQQRIAQTQTSVRMAAMRIERDIARAGLHGATNSARAQTCVTPAVAMQALDYDPDVDVAALPQAALNGVNADRLRLTGNYATSDVYFVRQLAADGGSLTLQQDWQSFRRDFVDPASGDIDQARFDGVFTVNRALHIVTLQGNEFFVGIRGTDAANGRVTLANAITPGGPCTGGLMTGAMVAPISTIEYAVVNPSDSANPSAADLTALVPPGGEAALDVALGRQNSILVRRELNRAGAVVAGSTQVVMEYVADFDVSFVFDVAAAGVAPDLQRLNGAAAAARLDPLAAPESVRAVTFRLSARTRQEESRFEYTPRVGPLTRYDVNPNVLGAARVRTLTREVFLPNVAFVEQTQ